jgi:hypothetical protein
LDNSLSYVIAEVILGTLLGLQGYFLKRMWSEKPDRVEVVILIKNAITEFKELDTELDEYRLGVLIEKIEGLKAVEQVKHSENSKRLDKIDDILHEILKALSVK